MTLVFAASTRTFSNYSMGNSDPQAFQNEVNGLVLYFVYLFVGRCVINYIGKVPSTFLHNGRLPYQIHRNTMRVYRGNPHDELSKEGFPRQSGQKGNRALRHSRQWIHSSSSCNE